MVPFGSSWRGFDLTAKFIWCLDDSRLRTRTWKALAKDKSSQAERWRHQFADLWQKRRDRKVVVEITTDHFNPHTVIAMLEHFVIKRYVSRSDDNTAMECILAETNARGEWR